MQHDPMAPHPYPQETKRMQQAKDKLRQHMKSLRQERLGDKEEAGRHAAARFLSTFEDLPKNKIIACYWAMKTELPTLPLMEELTHKGYHCCLPVIEERKPILTFASWTPQTQMIPGYHGILVPEDQTSVEPDVLVIPLLAFTRGGHRLGFGKGHYDHTLEALRKRKSILAIGYAYAQQEVDSLPQEQYDQTLDWILTDQEAIKGRI